MKAEKIQKELPGRTIQPTSGGGSRIYAEDNRPQTRLIKSIQKKGIVQFKRNMFSIHNGHTFKVDNRIVTRIMNDYHIKSREIIQNALDQMADPYGGNGIRLALQRYTAELKIQEMRDYRVFSCSPLANHIIWFNIIKRGLH